LRAQAQQRQQLSQINQTFGFPAFGSRERFATVLAIE